MPGDEFCSPALSFRGRGILFLVGNRVGLFFLLPTSVFYIYIISQSLLLTLLSGDGGGAGVRFL